MGLGPPVCEACMLTMFHDNRKGSKYFCLKCNTEATTTTRGIFTFKKEVVDLILKNNEQIKSNKNIL